MSNSYNNNIIIVSKVFYPSVSPRAHRSYELAKELTRKGYNVVVYTLVGDYDYSELEKKYKFTIKDLGPCTFITKTNTNSKESIINKIVITILNKYIDYPNIELVYRVYKIINKIKIKYSLITIAVPHTIHWGAAIAKNKNHKYINCWIADCGDPYYLNPIRKKMKYFAFIERFSFRKCDYITVPTENSIDGYFPEFKKKIHVIPQGFEIKSVNKNKKEIINNVIKIVYAGRFYNKIREPYKIIEYIINTKKNIEYEFTIYTHQKKMLQKYVDMSDGKIILKDYVERDKLLNILSQADFLVNISNISDVQIPSKLIDYALSNSPILNIDPNNIDTNMIDEFFEGNYTKRYSVKELEKYDIRNVVNKFEKLLNA